MPRLVERGHTVVHALPGYWRDLGQPHLYLAAHQDVLTDDQGLFDDPRWPILTRQPQRVPARVLDGADVCDSLVSPGARVAGVVRRSVLGPGVVVEAGAVVRNSVVFADTVVEAGRGRGLGDRRRGLPWSRPASVVGPPRRACRDDPDEVTIVGRDSRVDEDLAAGARLEPGTTSWLSRRRRPRRTPSRCATTRLIASARSGSPPQSRSERPTVTCIR